jgi:nucleoside-diphosphate-sugar epimerase
MLQVPLDHRKSSVRTDGRGPVKVLVTGGTGFVGSHTVAALIVRGHDVRVLARNPERVPVVLESFGIDAESVRGDVTDPLAVASALHGCDAVVHAAAEIGVGGAGGQTTDVNVVGTRTVLTEALAAGMDPIVYTSTVTVYLPSQDAVVTPSSALAEPLSAYGASKRDAELLVREHQGQGHPITSFTLGGIYGPTSPHLDGSFQAILGALGSMMLVPPGGLGVVDVRDAAELLARAVEPGKGPRHYLAGGQYVTWAEWTELLGEAAGVDLHGHVVSAEDMIEMGRQFDAQRELGPVDIPLSEEAAIIMTSGVPTDDSATLADLGMAYRPLLDTFRDTVAYLQAGGHLPTP